MRATESINLGNTTGTGGNISSGNGSWHPIKGGEYALTVGASAIDGNHTVQVQIMDPNGNAINASSAISTNDSLTILNLPPGQARVTVVGNLSAASIFLSMVPET